jgi:hypothetical protein
MKEAHATVGFNAIGLLPDGFVDSGPLESDAVGKEKKTH